MSAPQTQPITALVPGCCSAATPCNFQKEFPALICDVCQIASLKEQVAWWEEQGRQHVSRTQALEGALQTAQDLLAIIVNPKDHPNPSILHLRAQCVELERKTRDILQPKDGAK